MVVRVTGPYRIIYLSRRGDALRKAGDFDGARSAFEACLELCRRLGNRQGLYACRLQLSIIELRAQRYIAARAHAEQATSIARGSSQPRLLATALAALTPVAVMQGDFELASRLAAECAKIAAASPDPFVKALSLMILGQAQPTAEEARPYYRELLEMYRSQNNKVGVIAILCSLGHLAEPGRDNQEERAWLNECLALAQGDEHAQSFSYALNNLGNVERYDGNLDAAEHHFRDSLELKRIERNSYGVAYSLDGMAAVSAARGDGIRAARLLGAAAGIRKRLGIVLERSKRAAYEEDVSAARALVDPSTFDIEWEAGLRMSTGEAVDFALMRSGLRAFQADVPGNQGGN
jgi:non-specific serine/threonine protein kinase